MKSRNVRTIGIAWYRREDYPLILGVMDDAHVLPPDYDTWLRYAQRVVVIEETSNSDVVKATIEPQSFVAWCISTRQRPNVDARTRFVENAIRDSQA